MILNILLTLPVEKVFSYRIPTNLNNNDCSIGKIVGVNFRGSNRIGIIVGKGTISSLKKVKNINEVYKQVTIEKPLLNAIKFFSEYTCNRVSDFLKILLSNFDPKKVNVKINSQISDFLNGLGLVEKKLEVLNESQKNALYEIEQKGIEKFNVFVLNGVTGSGKTRVYLNIILKCLKKKKQCLVLVPEIFLTKQWIENFSIEFGFTPSIYHSSIKKTQKAEIWMGVATGKINLVIGTRSALFLPFCDLSFVVIDEEHDDSYKQEERIIFNARDYGIVLAKYFNCPVMLVSATPSLETIHNCKIKKYIQIFLKKRIKNLPLPKLNIIDMKVEPTKKDGWISKKLQSEIRNTLEENKQTLIFLNKRGYAPVIICKKCGKSKICPNCDYSLVFHKKYNKSSNDFMFCHWCDYKEVFQSYCENCNNESFKALGIGVQKICEEIQKLFPKAKILMISSDTIEKEMSMDKVINLIISKKVDIVIGTQIISKGHNFPDVSTIGIINIDNQLKSFDIRSNEKTYQILTQVSGRAGRKNFSRGVFIQTYYPNDKLLNFCIKNSNNKFYEMELANRRKNVQPPFCNLISIINQNKDLNLLQFQNKIISTRLKEFIELDVFGPSPSPIFKIKDKFRYRFLLKFSKNYRLKHELKKMLLKIKNNKKINIKVDVDPFNFI